MFIVYSNQLLKKGFVVMTVDNGVRVIAGTMIIISLLLTLFVHPMFVWLTAFVGLNLIQSAFTGFCPAATFLKKIGFK